MDLTPYVGIIGTVVGALIGGTLGLLGHRLNLREQRRKSERERVADFLREVDAVALQSDRLRRAAKVWNRAGVEAIIPDLRETLGKANHCAQYLDLTAPYLLQQYSRDLWFGADGVYTAGMDFWLAGAPQEQLDANWGLATTELATRRAALITHLRPNVNRMPWWTRRPFRNVVALWRKLRGLPAMNLP